MEEKINIAEILKDKPQGTKLYSPIFGKLRYEDLVPDLGEFTVVTSDNTLAKHSFRSDSRYNRHGEPLMLLPSKEMCDWHKFAWKKGDLLVNSCGLQCIFKEWASDDYTKFNGCYSNSKDGYEDVSNAETAKFVKLDNNIAYGYVREIERKLGGKLNLETLEIKKQLEFKDGDIVVYGKSVAICRRIYKHTLSFYVTLNEMFGLLFADEVESSEEYRFATDEDKQQLFDALAKEGKAWDAEKKQFVDLKPKVELKPFDKVLSRRCSEDYWVLNFYSHKTDYYYICIDGSSNLYCIPYNEGTAHLLGTTDDWEGGEQ